MIKTKKTLFVLSMWSAMAVSAFGQGTAFTYQGQLQSGTDAANGTYSFAFSLYAASTGGSVLGTPVTNNNVGVSNGLFTVLVDFGPNVFTGMSNWLQIAVATNGSSTFTNLSPRQQLTATPYAVYAETANASSLVGTLSGSGAGLTSLNASNLTSGTVADTRLSTNVALLNRSPQSFSGGPNSFVGNVGIGTNNPSTRLDIVGTGGSDDAKLLVETTGGTLGPQLRLKRGGANGDEWVFVTDGSANGPVNALQVVQSSGGTRLMIATNGNVGLGTTSPANKLEVNGSADFTGNIGIGTNNPGYAVMIAGRQYGFVHASGPVQLGTYVNPVEAVQAQFGTISAHNFGLVVNNGQPMLTLNTNGNVGIGTTTPGFPLTVAAPSYGFVHTFGPVQLGSYIDPNDATPAQFGTVTAHNFGLFVNNQEPVLNLNTSGNVGIGTTTPNNKLEVQGSADFTDNVGIGTTSPNTEKLVVAGGVDVTQPASNPGGDIGLGISFESFGGRLQSFELKPLILNPVGNNVGIFTTTPQYQLDVNGEIGCTAVNLTSDRNAKEDFKSLDPREVLAKVAALPITEWQYKAEKDKDGGGARHIGPMAQDFSAAFALGHDEKHISVIDEGGVALAAIQGLNEKVEEKDARIQELEKSVTELKDMVAKLAREQNGGAQ